MIDFRALSGNTPRSAKSRRFEAGEAALIVRDLKVRYDSPAAATHALGGVSFQLAVGETLGVVGMSGSGKSVLARALFGLIRPPGRIAGGSAELAGFGDLLTMSPRDLSVVRGNVLGLIVSSPRSRLNPLINVGSQIANLIRAKQGLSHKGARERAVELLGSVALGDPRRVATLLPHELSGGMCQRVIIAMALANSPKVLIADEPTFGLDVTVQRQVLDLMMQQVREVGAGLLLMTRDLGILAHYAERIVVLNKGVVIEEQPVQSFFARPQHSHSQHLLRASFAARGEVGG